MLEVTPSSLIPLNRQNWRQLEQDLWRMEKWLELATATLRSQTRVPTNMEQLEDAIGDHREFLLELDSHKSLMMSINVIGSHLAEHSTDERRTEETRRRLEEINGRWDDTCEDAASWQTKLQTALLEVRRYIFGFKLSHNQMHHFFRTLNSIARLTS